MANESPTKKKMRKATSSSSSTSKLKMPPSDMHFPPEVYTKRSTVDVDRLGVWCQEPIPKGRTYGPFQGRKVSYIRSDLTDPSYVWEIADKETREHLFYIDATDPRHSNWMRYMNSARFFEEQNIVSEQEDVDIYYRVIKDISPGEELLTWYEQPKIKRIAKQKSKRNSQGGMTQENTSAKSDTNSTTTTPKSESPVVMDKTTPDKKLSNSQSKSTTPKSKPPIVIGNRIEKKKPNSKSKSVHSISLPKRYSKHNRPLPKMFKSTTNKPAAEVPMKRERRMKTERCSKKNITNNGEVDENESPQKRITALVEPADVAENLVDGYFEFQVRSSNIVSDQPDGVRSFTCDICVATYKHVFSLKRHFLRTHVANEFVSHSDRLNCNIASPAPLLSPIPDSGSDGIRSPADDIVSVEQAFSDVHSAVSMTELAEASMSSDLAAEDYSACNESSSMHKQLHEETYLSDKFAASIWKNQTNFSKVLDTNSTEDIADATTSCKMDTNSHDDDDSELCIDLGDAGMDSSCSSYLETNMEAIKNGNESSTNEPTSLLSVTVKEDNTDNNCKVPLDSTDSDNGIDSKSSSKLDIKCQETSIAVEPSMEADVTENGDSDSSSKVDTDGAETATNSTQTSIDGKLSVDTKTKQTSNVNSPSKCATKESALLVDGSSSSDLDKNGKHSTGDVMNVSSVGTEHVSTANGKCDDLPVSQTEQETDVTNHVNAIKQETITPKVEDGSPVKIATGNDHTEKINYMGCVNLNDAAVKLNLEYQNGEWMMSCTEPVTGEYEANAAIFRCNLCTSRFSTRCKVWQHLQEHTNHEHAGKVHTCTLCGMTFSHRQNLSRHRIVHAGTRPYVCQFCGKRFPTATNRARHEHIHSGRRLSCALCPRTFTQASDVRRHVRRVHPAQHHECGVCGSCFTTHSLLERHARCHDDESPPIDESNFVCTLCECRFHDYANMCRHRRLAHQKDDRRAWLITLPPETQPPSPPPPPTVQPTPPTKTDESFYANVSQLISDNLGRYIIGTRSHLDRPRDHRPPPKCIVEGATDLALYNFPSGYHWRAPAETTRSHRCSECGRAMQNFKSYREHMYVRHRHIVDPTSTTDAVKLPDDSEPKVKSEPVPPLQIFSSLDWTLQMHNKLYMCKACGEEFDSLQTMTGHQEKQHANVWCSHLVVDADTRPLVWTRPTPVGLLRAVHNQPPLTDKTVKVPKAHFVCTKCESPHESIQTLHDHIITCAALCRVGIEPFIKRSSRTKRHYRKRQPGDPPSRRPRVSWIHKRGVYEPTRHVRRRELMEPLEMACCGGCLRQFHSISLLERHAKVCLEKDRLKSLQLIVASNAPQNDDEDGDPDATYDPKKQTCIYCLRQFKYRGTLRVHVAAKCPRRQELVDAGDPIDNEWEASLGEKSTENGGASNGDKEKVVRKRNKRRTSEEWKKVSNSVVKKEDVEHGTGRLPQSELAMTSQTDVISMETTANGVAEKAKVVNPHTVMQNSGSNKTHNKQSVPLQKRSGSAAVDTHRKRSKSNDGTDEVTDNLVRTEIQPLEADDTILEDLLQADGQQSKTRKTLTKRAYTRRKRKEGLAKGLTDETTGKATTKKGHPASANGVKTSPTNVKNVLLCGALPLLHKS